MSERWREDREWFWLSTRRGQQQLGCCDCGAVHQVVGRVTKDRRIQIQCVKDEALSEQMRIKHHEQFSFRRIE